MGPGYLCPLVHLMSHCRLSKGCCGGFLSQGPPIAAFRLAPSTVVLMTQADRKCPCRALYPTGQCHTGGRGCGSLGVHCILSFTLADWKQVRLVSGRSRLYDTVLPGPPEPQQWLQTPRGDTGTPEVREAGTASCPPKEALSGSCCDSQPVGPGYVQEVTSAIVVCPAPSLGSGGPFRGQVS